MLTKPGFRCLSLLVTAAFVHNSLAGDVLSQLSSAQQQEVKNGKQVLVTESVEGKAWPLVRVYRIISATPEEVAAVFFDYANAKSFVPNLLKSDVSKKISSCSFEVDYGVDVPLFPDEFYTVRNSLVKKGDVYIIDWKLIRALQTKDSVGEFRVEPLGEKSLIRYENLVTPGSSMAGLLKGKAVDQMEQTVTAIGKKVESQKKNQPQDLQRQVDAMRAALAQEK